MLRSHAQYIVAAIQTALGPEISKMVHCLARRLHSGVKLKYDRISNNCQDFSSAILSNYDECDTYFDGVYLKMLPRCDQILETRTFRYMMSLAGRMQHKKLFISLPMSSL